MKKPQDLILVGSSPNFAYICGEYFPSAFFLSSSNKKIILAHKISEGFYRAKSRKFKVPVKFYSTSTEFKKSLISFFKTKKIGVDNHLSFSQAVLFKSFGFNLINISDYFSNKRQIKTQTEIKQLKKIARQTRRFFSLYFLEAPLYKNTEHQIYVNFLSNVYSKDFSISFEPIISSGSFTRFPHSFPRNKSIKDPFLMDIGLKKKYVSDMTRCFPTDPRIKAKYELLQNIFYQLIDFIPTVEKWAEVSGFSKKLYEKYMLPYPSHSLGHGVGLEVHEPPFINSKSKDLIKKNQVFTLEPSVYFSNYGLRFEEMLLFNGKKARIL